jgi:hypothetical protein
MSVPKGKRTPRSAGGPKLTEQSSRQARLLAAAILEVLAGLRNPAQAAAAVGLSLQRYYQLESRALRGLLEACESKPCGRRRDATGRELTTLRQQVARLQREVTRQQTLVRLAQRSIGLPATPATPARPAKKGGKRRRRTCARAVPVVARLRQEVTPESVDSPTDPTHNGDATTP